VIAFLSVVLHVCTCMSGTLSSYTYVRNLSSQFLSRPIYVAVLLPAYFGKAIEASGVEATRRLSPMR
jgi:hypothetical protein